VSTSFGIVGGLLRTKDWSNCNFLTDCNFDKIIDCINSINLGIESAKYTQRDHKTTPEEIIFLEEKLEHSRKETESLRSQLEASSSVLKKLRIQNQDNHTPPNSSIFPPKSADSGYKSASTPALSPNIEELTKKHTSRPTIKRRAVESISEYLKKEINDVCNSHRESLSTVLAHQILSDDEATQDTLDELLDILIKAKGTKEGFKSIFSGEKWTSYFKTLRRPDWALLYFKIKAKLPDESWQTLLNITNLGRTGVR